MTTHAAAAHPVAKKKHNPWTIFDFVKMMAVGFLLIPAAQSLGQEDYYFIRWLVTLVTAFGAVRSFRKKNYVWGCLFLAPAVIFNPFLPISMFREAWIVTDLGTAILLAVSLTQPL